MLSIIRYIASMYQQRWDEQMILGWEDALSDINRLDWLQIAAREMVRRHEGIPTVARLREFYVATAYAHRYDEPQGPRADVSAQIADENGVPLDGDESAARAREILDKLRGRMTARRSSIEEHRRRIAGQVASLRSSDA